VELAIFSGKLDYLKLLLAHRADASHVRRNDGNSLLMMAAYKGEFEMAKELTAAGADFSHKNRRGHCVRDILSAVHQKHPFEVGLPDDEALVVAAESNDTALLEKCIAVGTPVDTQNEEGLTALALASYFASLDCVNALIQHKADPNIRGDDGGTPLLLATYEGHVDVVRALTNGYDAASLDQAVTLNRNTTALYLASQDNRVDIIKALLAHSKDGLEICRDDGVSPLYVSAHEGHEDCVDALVAAKANVNACTQRRTSVLQIAAQKNHKSICEKLLANDANPNVKNTAGSSPLMVAVFHCNADIVRLLLTHGARVDDQSALDGSTVTMLAAGSLDVDIVCQLILRGASLNTRNAASLTVDDVLRTKHGISVLDIAYHCLGTHAELDKLSAADGKDAINIFKLFESIDADKSDTITKAELMKAMEEWGIKSKYGESFSNFVNAEFDRLDQDEDGGVCLPEFRACYARFHLLYRSSVRGTETQNGDREANDARLLAAEFPPSVPEAMRQKSRESTAKIWSSFRKDAVCSRVDVPKHWFSYLVERRSGASSDDLLQLVGFDVEEVTGGAEAPQEQTASVDSEAASATVQLTSFPVPRANTKYLRVTAVDSRAWTHFNDHIHVGDVLMQFFGEEDVGCLRSRDEFADMCRKLPFCFVWVYRE